MRFICKTCGCPMFSENEIGDSAHRVNETIDRITCPHCFTKHRIVIAVIVKRGEKHGWRK